jgi:lipopolysaccharide transport system ATP-binding protein
LNGKEAGALKPIIRVESLGKEYRIGHRDAPYATLRESLAKAARAPFSRARQAYLNARDSFRPQPPAPSTTHHSRLTTHSSPDRFWALQDVSFEVQPGEVVGIIGRNGAGKSTLLKILSRITEPTTGLVDLYGRVGSLLEVGTGFHPELTGRENIFLNGALLGMKQAEIATKLDAIVAFSGIDRFLDTPVKRYSSGMAVRLAFAVAAHLDPDILIVDEVLAVGDATYQRQCITKMRDIAAGGCTVLFVSHSIDLITKLCSR